MPQFTALRHGEGGGRGRGGEGGGHFFDPTGNEPDTPDVGQALKRFAFILNREPALDQDEP